MTDTTYTGTDDTTLDAPDGMSADERKTYIVFDPVTGYIIVSDKTWRGAIRFINTYYQDRAVAVMLQQPGQRAGRNINPQGFWG